MSSAGGYPLDLQRTGWWYVLWTDFLGAILLVEVLSQHQKYIVSISYCAHIIYIPVLHINEDTEFSLGLCEGSDLIGHFITCMLKSNISTIII